MRHFDEILAIAIARKGGLTNVEAAIPAPATVAALAGISADRWLSRMTQNIFRAGFNRKIINDRWPAFEAAFAGFDPHRCANMSDDWFDELLHDTCIIRNGARIRSVQRNAVFILAEAERQGNFGRFIGGFGPGQFLDLLNHLRTHGDRLGDKTAQYLLREAGADGYVLSFDVVHRLSIEGVADKVPTSGTQRLAIQRAFDVWREQSGQGLTYISRVLAMSVDEQRPSVFRAATQ